MINQDKLRFSSAVLALFCGWFLYSNVFAVGFGDVLLRSNLGQGLNAQVAVFGVPEDDLSTSCIRAKVETIDGAFIATPRVEFVTPRSGASSTNPSALINLITKESITEPAVTLSIADTCGGTVQRSYSLLLDYAEISAPVAAATRNNSAAEEMVAEAPVARKLAKTSPSQVAASAVKKSAVTKRKKDDGILATSPPQKDQLKISNEEVTPKPGLASPASTPTSAAKATATAAATAAPATTVGAEQRGST